MEEPGPLTQPLQEETAQIPSATDLEGQSLAVEELPHNPLANSPFSQYFAHLHPQPDLLEVNQKYNQQIQSRIQQAIQEGDVKVSRNKRQLDFPSKPLPSQREVIAKEKATFLQKKRDVLQKLSQVYIEEKSLLMKNSSLMKSSLVRRSQSSLEVRVDSNWLAGIKLAIKKHRKFKSTLKQRDREAEDNKQQIKQQQNSSRHSVLLKMKQGNSAEAQKRIEVYNRTKLSQKQIQQKCSDFISRLKPRKYQHESKKEAELEQLRRDESQRSAMLQQFCRKKQVDDWEMLREHEYRYFQFLQERKSLWLDQFYSMKEEHKSRLMNHRGLYAERAREEQQALRRSVVVEGGKGLMMLEKIKNYDEYVHSHFKPRTTQKGRLNPEGEKGSSRAKSLDRTEARMKGLEYLHQVKETAKSVKSLPKSHQLKGSEDKPVSLPKIQSQTTYKNYLNEMPRRRKQGSDVDQFQAALTDKRGSWAESALNLISKMETTDIKKGEKPLLETVFNKIELLKAMY